MQLPIVWTHVVSYPWYQHLSSVTHCMHICHQLRMVSTHVISYHCMHICHQLRMVSTHVIRYPLYENTTSVTQCINSCHQLPSVSTHVHTSTRISSLLQRWISKISALIHYTLETDPLHTITRNTVKSVVMLWRLFCNQLLVNKKIISLDLPVKEVYKKVWLPEHGEVGCPLCLHQSASLSVRWVVPFPCLFRVVSGRVDTPVSVSVLCCFRENWHTFP